MDWVLLACQEVYMFSVKDRDRIRDWVLELAASDRRVVAGAASVAAPETWATQATAAESGPQVDRVEAALPAPARFLE